MLLANWGLGVGLESWNTRQSAATASLYVYDASIHATVVSSQSLAWRVADNCRQFQKIMFVARLMSVNREHVGKIKLLSLLPVPGLTTEEEQDRSLADAMREGSLNSRRFCRAIYMVPSVAPCPAPAHAPSALPRSLMGSLQLGHCLLLKHPRSTQRPQQQSVLSPALAAATTTERPRPP
jgi:hypothetical protein